MNYSNHPSHLWGERQREAAQRYGEIVDLPFPNIPPDLSERELDELAQREAGNILSQNPKCVLCQGEFTFTYRIINRLKAHQIKVVAACSERVATEKNVDGKTVKAAEFVFQGFREY